MSSIKVNCSKFSKMMAQSNTEENDQEGSNLEPKNVSDQISFPEHEKTTCGNKCAICLGPFENESKTDSCQHRFCFTCIVEWSKVRHACPLCKTAFETVIHSIKDGNNFKSFILPAETTEDNDGAVFVSYQELKVFLDQIRQFSENIKGTKLKPKTVSSFIYSSRIHVFRYLWSRSQGFATSTLRYNIYTHNLHVEPNSIVDKSGRVKECSPSWYRNNPAQTHHLVPWLGRELSALIQFEANLIPRIIDLIIEIIQLFDIKSKEFYEQMVRHTGEKTMHFQHEFYNFARSTYGILEYDLRARYNETSNISTSTIPITIK